MKIIQEREKCIGCGACTAVCPRFWEMADDRKASLKGAEKVNDNYELEVEEPYCNEDAEASCPVNIIHVKK